MLTNNQEVAAEMKENRANSTDAAETVRSAKPAYVAPRIVTHSAEKLQQTSHPVNACSSFIP